MSGETVRSQHRTDPNLVISTESVNAREPRPDPNRGTLVMTNPLREALADGVEIHLGDCCEILPTLESIDHILTDPPFDQEAHTPARRARSGGLHQNMPLDFAPLNANTRLSVAIAAKQVCTGWFIAFCQTEQVSFWRDDIEAAGLKYKAPMIWDKPDSVPKLNGQGPAIGYESMVTAWCGPGYARWNAGGKRGVYRCLTNGPDRTHTHMTEKPVKLMRELIGDFTNPGQTVCDPFMGSGTTGVAAVKIGRKFIGIEIDPKHFDTACRRISEALRQPDLFVAPPSRARQEVLL